MPDTKSADNIPMDHFGPGIVLTIHPAFILTLANGRVYYFDWHKYLGPTFTRKDGEPLKRYPSERHQLWPAFNAWHSQGRMVDGKGNCIYKL